MKEMNRIRVQLTDKKDLIVSQTVAISELGGIGKTQNLLRQFIKQFGESDFFGRVIWISAQNYTLVDKSFKRLGEHLKFQKITKKNTKTIIGEVFEYFEGLKD